MLFKLLFLFLLVYWKLGSGHCIVKDLIGTMQLIIVQSQGTLKGATPQNVPQTLAAHIIR